MKMSPRAKQYAFGLSNAEIDQLVSVPPKQIALGGADARVRAGLLENGLRSVVLPDAQMRGLLRQLTGMAQAHALSRMDSEATYIEGLYSKKPWGHMRSPAICFSGLQGVGKSQVLQSLSQILQGTSRQMSVLGHAGIDLIPIWLMTLAKGDRLNQLLREHVDPAWRDTQSQIPVRNGSAPKSWSVPKVLEFAERASWKHATCLAAIDEFQWISASSSANARAASVLLRLHGIGPLLLYCANFSLGHKLKGRPPEDRDRLLSCPVIMRPFSRLCPDFTAYLQALQAVAPDVLVFDPVEDQEGIYMFSFGVRRKVVDLLVAAYKIASRPGGTGKVGVSEMRDAYRSELYAMHREDVEILFRQLASGMMERETLWCPFGSMQRDKSNVTEAAEIINAFEKRVEDDYLRESLTPSEAQALDALQPQALSNAKPAKVLRFRKGKATKEDLLAGAAILDRFL
jgi:hypothetical protein